MEDWTRVLLYGTYDGFTRSTDGLSQINVILDGGERVEVPKEFVVSADQMVNKNKIKLKDVIARIEKFDLWTKAVWINEILYKLVSNYGLHKYYEGYKQGKLEGALEREKVTIPQRIDEFITEQKKLGHTLSYSIDACMPDQVAEWYWDNSELFALAWINGYTVEKEKRYRVKAKGVSFNSCLIFEKINKTWFFSSIYEKDHQREHHTRKELEEAGFGEVFNSSLFEVAEVEE